jgi:hypothetical protein
MAARAPMRRWGVYCADGIAWEDDLSKQDADISSDEADELCSCGGPHEIRPMAVEDLGGPNGSSSTPASNFS